MLKKKQYEAPASEVLEVYFEDRFLTVSGDANCGDEPGLPGGDDIIIDIPDIF